MQWRLLVSVGAAALGLASEARADDPGAPPKRDPPVHWHDEWPRFSLAEGMISAAVTLRNGDVGGALDGPNSATVEGKVPLIDPGFRDLLRGRNPQTIKAATRISDLGFRTMVFVPYVIDVGVASLAVHRNLDVAAQLALIDFEVLTLAGMTQLVVSRTVGRGRPVLDRCPPEGCGSGPYRSFLSGHAMASFTAAGLVCRHHQELPLFGGGAPDTWACIWSVSLASLTGTMRVVADQHWTSDVLLGAGVGWVFGYYLPKLLHFHAKKMTAPKADGSTRTFMWMPTLAGTNDGGLLGAVGTF